MARTLRTILVGTSLDPASDGVLRSALRLGAKAGADVYLVHGFPLPVIYGGGIYAAHGNVEVDAQTDRVLVEAQLARIGVEPSAFKAIIVRMETGDRLLGQLADELDADLVVIGASETAAALQPFLGSTADRLLRRTTRPVLVVRGELRSLDHVLAPTDLSDLSEHAIARGLELLDPLGPPARVDALFVLSSIDREGSAHFKPEQVDRFATEELEAFIGRLPGRPESQVRPVLRNGHAREEVLAYLTANPDVDLVLLGTHGRSGFERFLLGSIAVELLRRIPLSALVLPPEAKTD
jgi:nucleotide-binding universal stress UspA family protein